MGLNQSEKISYLQIINGKIATKTTAGTSGAVEITNKTGDKRHYLMYKSISGLIHKISYKPPPDTHSEWGWQWNITLKDNADFYNLNMSFGSGYANSFFCILENVNLEKEVEIIPIQRTEIYEGKEKEKRSLFIKQGEEVLKWFYRKDLNADLPEIEVTKTKSGKVIYDDTERNEFFKKIANKINEKLFEIHGRSEIKNATENKQVLYEVSQDDTVQEVATNKDDLPF